MVACCVRFSSADMWRKMKVLLALTLLSVRLCQPSCLHGAHHKGAPGPETAMQECQLYSKSSCCHANFTEKISPSPLIQVDHFYWNRCGNLSKACEDYMKRIECFYQCSPLAAHWVHPNISAALQSVPLCQSFCDGWFNACRSDLVCAHNFITDWTIDESGNHCKNECIPYDQMYVSGADLCSSSWGPSFVVSPSPCRCLDMSKTDDHVIDYILKGDSKEEACKLRLQGPHNQPGPNQHDDHD